MSLRSPLGMPQSEAQRPLDLLEQRVKDRSATVGIVGLGYVGLPLALELSRSFPAVVGFDMNSDRVDCVNARRSHVQDVSEKELAFAIDAERFRATGDFAELSECDGVIICVPTPLEKSKDPDLSYIRGAAASIAGAMRPGQLIVLESTTYPGTTDELLLPLFRERGFELDRDFLLAFSPERVDPGSGYPLHKIPKVVGGCSARSTALAHDVYAAAVVSVHDVSSARVAETVKLLENTFRLVNIGLINEFAVLCNHLGIDTNEVIDAAATKPFGFMPFTPGPGVGGHCIPLDPLYLSWKAEQQGFIARFIDLADQVNTQMPAYVVELVANGLNERAKALRDARILVVGVAYKGDIDDTRQSPAIAVIDRLRAKGAFVAYHDPLVPVLDFDFHDWPEWRPVTRIDQERRSLRVAKDHAYSRRRRYDMLESVPLSAHVLEDADCVVILTKHSKVNYGLIARHAELVVDTRDAIGAEDRARARGQIVRL
jgi:UDP-N-acetyl-D-glucosamine dehydrogenase